MGNTTYGYIRVSTDKQTTENQKYEIELFAKEKGLTIQKWVEETVSGTKRVDQRKLGKLLNSLKKGDVLVTSEISRIGRRILEVMSIFYHLTLKGVLMYSVKENFYLEDTFTSCLVSFSYMLQAQLERDMISARTKSGLARRVAAGMKLGRKVGGKNKKYKLSGKEELIRTMVEYKYSKAEMCRKLKCNLLTLDKHLEREGIKWEKHIKVNPKKEK